MAWTATLLRKEDNTKFVDFVVEFTDGIKVVVEQFRSTGSLDAAGVKRQISNRLTELEKLSVIDIAIGEKDFTAEPTPAPPVKDPPTQEDIDFRAWSEQLNQLRTMEELVTLGAVTDTHAKVLALRTTVTTGFQEAFLVRLGVR